MTVTCTVAHFTLNIGEKDLETIGIKLGDCRGLQCESTGFRSL